MTIQDLPALNATLNGLATLFIIAGLIAIKREAKQTHRFCMLSAIVVSGLFLTSYLIYHTNVSAVTKFTHEGLPKSIYRFILFTHIPLAAFVLPLLWVTVMPAIKGDYAKHRWWVRITAPVWLYVSITGVLVYLMLYVWYPSADKVAG